MTKCLICNSVSQPYFLHEVDEKFTSLLLKNEYYQCTNCFFTFSKTMHEIDEEKFEHINKIEHIADYTPRNDYAHRPPYLQQALLFHILSKYKLIDENKILDYAAGLGQFAQISKKHFTINVHSYDEYLVPDGLDYISKQELHSQKFSLVFSSALLEHIRDLSPIEEMLSCLDEEGIFAFHTLVCEKPPKDPHWFYYTILHCSVFANMSMQALMDKYSFSHSVYCPTAKTWLLFKENKESKKNNDKFSKSKKDIVSLVAEINKDLQYEYLFYKEGFMDYWK